MNLKFFANAPEFRNWLSGNHDKTDELWVGYYKKATGIPSITWTESVDEALCFGWIDGLRKSIDEKRYCIRFTPRRANSNWSEVNINRVKALKKSGKMQPAGLLAFKKRSKYASEYSYERKSINLDKKFEDQLKANKKAWEYFKELTPAVRKMSVTWVMSAVRDETKLRRLRILIESSQKGQKIPPLIISMEKSP